MKKILDKNHMKFKLPLYAYLFIHFLRQVFHLKYEISSIYWSFLKHMGKLQNVKKNFTKSLFFRASSTLNANDFSKNSKVVLPLKYLC